jgi:hypothetical protein
MTKPPVEPPGYRRPPHPFYLVAVNEALQRGELAEIQELLKGAKEVKAQHGDLDSLITKLEAAAKKAQK